jgi:hypothetical protein
MHGFPDNAAAASSVDHSKTEYADIFNSVECHIAVRGKRIRAIGGDNKFIYYTCSSSSLERVFMEIMHLSEHENAVFTKDSQPTAL